MEILTKQESPEWKESNAEVCIREVPNGTQSQGAETETFCREEKNLGDRAPRPSFFRALPRHALESTLDAVASARALATTSPRLLALDAHRGLIMVIMALDHASSLVAKVHGEEYWGTALPVYTDVFWFVNRWLSHLCAPGFFFLMGISMIFLADARRQAGWSQGRITRFFVTRGILLIGLQLFLEDPVWILNFLTSLPGATVNFGSGGVPGGDPNSFILHFGQLYALGGAMIIWAFLLPAPAWLIGAVSLAAVLGTQLVIPGPEFKDAPYAPILRLLVIAGRTGIWNVNNPLVPWLGATGLGLLFGRLLKSDMRRVPRIAGWTGAALLALFAVIRIAGGFGDLHEVPPGWMGFLNVVKYPPSLAFLAVTLGIHLILLSIWPRVEPYLQKYNRFHPLPVFGRSALFFYLVHLWLYSLIGVAFFRGGSSLPTLYGIWLVGLAVLYPLCYWYGGFKRLTRVTSIWRFF